MSEEVTEVKRNRRWLIFLLAPFVLLLLFWAAGEFLIIEKTLPRADIAFVLSGNTFWGERSHHAAELYKAGRVSKIILTNDNIQAGWEEGLQRNPYYWEWERWYLINQGVPESDIEVLPPTISGTYYEAVLLAQTARERGWRSVILVTSPLHTRRTLWTTQRVLARENLAVEIGIEPAKNPQNKRYWWMTRRNWRMAATEYVKFAYYWLFY